MAPPNLSDCGDVRMALAVERGAFRLDVDLKLPGKGITALFGPSGAGKTTCLRLLAGLDRGRGSVHVLGECWQDDARGVFVPAHRRGAGFVFQNHALLPHLSVEQNIEFGRKRNRRPPRIEVDFVVDLLGVAPLLDRRPAALSGGELQRAAIAQALLAQPNLLLMDEPLSALDAARKAEVIPYLERLRNELSLPIVYVSHALEEVARMADHAVWLDSGKVSASGPVQALLARLDLPTAAADDAGVVLEARVTGHASDGHLSELSFDGGRLWVGRVDRAAGASVRVRILARDVSLALQPPGPSSILNVIAARVVEMREAGAHQVNVRLAVGERGAALLSRVTHRSVDNLGLRVGLDLYAQVKSVALLV